MSDPESVSSGDSGTLRARLALPVICAPMFLVSGPDLVIAASRSGVIGSFPATNARSLDVLDAWMTRVADELAEPMPTESARTPAPWALNLVVHSSYERLPAELELTRLHRPPIVITALGNPARVTDTVREYGGIVLADVASLPMARSESDHAPRAWKDIWSAGQSVGTVKRVEPAAQIVARLRAEYVVASRRPAFGE